MLLVLGAETLWPGEKVPIIPHLRYLAPPECTTQNCYSTLDRFQERQQERSPSRSCDAALNTNVNASVY